MALSISYSLGVMNYSIWTFRFHVAVRAEIIKVSGTPLNLGEILVSIFINKGFVFYFICSICLSTIRVNKPPFFFNSSGEPLSATVPLFSTTILSALAIVRIR